MLEIEQKFARADFAALERRLADLGARTGAVHDEADHYLNAPDRDFARTDEALRLRRTGDRNDLTYKGPKLDAQTKTRVEIRADLAEGEDGAGKMRQVLLRLGYREVGVIRKDRAVFELAYGGFRVECCLDEVEGVGSYVELEIPTSEDRGDAARRALLELGRDLGLSGSERRSYLELWLEKHQGEAHAP